MTFIVGGGQFNPSAEMQSEYHTATTNLAIFLKDGFCMKQLMKADMPLNKETKPIKDSQNSTCHTQ